MFNCRCICRNWEQRHEQQQQMRAFQSSQHQANNLPQKVIKTFRREATSIDYFVLLFVRHSCLLLDNFQATISRTLILLHTSRRVHLQILHTKTILNQSFWANKLNVLAYFVYMSFRLPVRPL